ncbi:lipocalin/fatty-acid binding family protein (plasmid) [Streptomyces sp. BI20]|uniref:lipocalin/fatty-acid binding family protein n=1 Tax=Streptomyces sp. BI20 TaxID=3403460 RepID=UPI003C7676FF
MAGGAFTDFSGTYEPVGSEGYAAFLAAIGVDEATREVLAADPQGVRITQEGDQYTFRSTVAGKESVLRFTLGQEFIADYGYGDDRRAKGIARRDGNRIVLRRKSGEVESTDVYTVDDEGNFGTALIGPNGVSATRSHKRSS